MHRHRALTPSKALWKLWLVNIRSNSSRAIRASVSATVEPGCDLHRRACAATLPDGSRIELSITPRPIPMITPLQVEVKTAGLEASKVEVDFAGVDMNMGYNRQTLTAADDGSYRGQATIPVCVTGRMLWVATLLIETDRQKISVPFRFEAPV